MIELDTVDGDVSFFFFLPDILECFILYLMNVFHHFEHWKLETNSLLAFRTECQAVWSKALQLKIVRVS